MGTNQDPLQAAEVRILAVMGALLNGTLYALVCMTIHGVLLLLFVMELGYPRWAKTYISPMLMIDFFSEVQYNICGICEFSQICIMKDGYPSLKRKEFCHDL